MIAYFGTYIVDEVGKSVVLRVDASSFPSQVGRDQKRMISSITANGLTFTNPSASGGEITYVMKRATTLASN